MGDEIMGSLGLFPKVGGTCPACGNHTLFLGEGGWPTCGYLPCPNPTATCADEVASVWAERTDLVRQRDLAYSVLRKLEVVQVESMTSIPWAWTLTDTTMTDDELALVERIAGSTTPVTGADQ